MLSDEKVLITGPAGRIAHGIAKMLAPDNEVWGIARFSDAAARKDVEALGVTTRASISATPTSATFRPISPTCSTSPPTSGRTTSAACVSMPKARDFCCRTAATPKRRW